MEEVTDGPQERVQNRTVEQIVDLGVREIQEELTELQEHVQQFIVPGAQTGQRTMEVPQAQFIIRAMDTPVVQQMQITRVQTIHENMVSPHEVLQFNN